MDSRGSGVYELLLELSKQSEPANGDPKRFQQRYIAPDALRGMGRKGVFSPVEF